MSLRETLAREVQVALSRRAQPVWFRVVKWIAIVVLLVRYWAHPSFWRWLSAALVFSLALHFTYRWKTRGWTRPWGGWDDVQTPR